MSIAVQAFLLCKSVAVAKPSQLIDVQGIFDVVTASNFPVTYRNCAVYCRLFLLDERKCSLSIVMESPSLEEVQLLAPHALTPDPNGRIKLTCNLPQLKLNEEGIFTLQLRVNGQTRSEFHVTAVKQRK